MSEADHAHIVRITKTSTKMTSDEIIGLQTKPIEDMTRWEVINALRSYAHPSAYHGLLSWSTAKLMSLLTYYRHEETE